MLTGADGRVGCGPSPGPFGGCAGIVDGDGCAPGAPVSAPLGWDELPHVAPEQFTVATMPARFAARGDAHAAIDDAAYSLQPLLDLYEADLADGLTDMPYPPDYPKMPGEPKRVQPSRDRDRPRD